MATRLWTVQELANAAGTSKQAIFLAIWRGRILAQKIGNFYVIGDDEAQGFLQSRGVA